MTKKGKKPAGEAIWRTAMGRSDFAFRSMLYSVDGPFFLSVAHLEGLIDQRRRLTRASAISFAAAIAISFLILLNQADHPIDIKTPLGEIVGLRLSVSVLLFALSIAVGYYLMSLLNHMLINKQIVAIFEHRGLPGPEAQSRASHATARWSANELWIDLFSFRADGFPSGPIHTFFILTSLLIMIAMLSAQLAVILVATWSGFSQAQAGDPWAYWLLAVPAVASINIAIVGAIALVTIPMRFAWTPHQSTPSVPVAQDNPDRPTSA